MPDKNEWDNLPDFSPVAQASVQPTAAPAPIKTAEWDHLPDYSPPKSPSFVKDAARETVDKLPMIGGVLGGIIGTPLDAITGPAGTIVGAGIGGYLGTATKNVINHFIDPEKAPKTNVEAITQPFVGGAEQALMQGTGEALAPYLEKGVKAISGPISEKLSSIAANKAISATGATGKQSMKFAPEAGQDLLDRGIVKFGDSQSAVAQKATDALDNSSRNISNVLSDLDNRGATVDHSAIVGQLRKRASEISSDPSQFGVSDGLTRLADRIENMVKADGANANIPLTKAENIKRGFQSSANYNSPPIDLSLSKEAAGIYRQSVEDAATKFDPKSADAFIADKKAYGLLKPVKDAAEKRAATLAQSPHGGLLDIATMAAGEGIAGAPGAILAPIARRAITTRIPSTMAATANAASGMIKGAGPIASESGPIAANAIIRNINPSLIRSAAADQIKTDQSSASYKWAQDGSDRLGLDDDLANKVISDPRGMALLHQASGMPPNSPAMKKIKEQIMKGWGSK